MPQSGAQMCSQDVSERMLGTFRSIVGAVNSSLRNVALGGTSVIIVVGVALDTVKQMEAQMLMRHHKGFLE